MLGLKFLVWLLIVAVCEELFFRGLLLDAAIHWLHGSKLTTALVVSVLFALAHLVNLRHQVALYVSVQVGLALGMGMLLAAFYWQYGLVSCIMVHGLVNVVSIFTHSIIAQVLPVYVLIAILSFGYGLYALRKLERQL